MDTRLRKSIEQYRTIVDHARQLESLLSAGEPERLHEYTARLNELQKDAGRNDQVLLDEIAQDSARWQAHPLFIERAQLLKQIMEMNDLLLPRIRGIMSVTVAELAQLKDGREAVAGYYPAAPKAKGSLGVG